MYRNINVNIGVISESIFVTNGVHYCVGVSGVKTLELRKAYLCGD